ncbi:MAG: transposase [Anaerolineales bacterium]|nr:transposase [Anaerolineales bacterium]
MTEIVALLQSIAPIISTKTLRQLSQVVYGMLISQGRITMLALSRWTEKGGSYRTIQRRYHTPMLWLPIQWVLFASQFHRTEHEYIAAGDEVVFGKAGKETYGLGGFFSSLQNRVIPRLSFFVFSLINVQERRSYPIQAVQIIKESKQPKQKREKKKATQEKRRAVGRPKGSKNKKKAPPTLSPEWVQIQPSLQAFLAVLQGVLTIRYLVLDGHFGNYPSAWLVLQTGLQLVSKFRSDAALYEPFAGKYCGHGPHPKYGDKVDVRSMKKKSLKADETEAGIRTQIYQATLLNHEFAFPINVVVILKTNLSSKKQAYVILFSTDLELSYEKLYDYYTLRFQIEFNFRDAKQYWGLDDFMNIKKEAVTNAAHLSFFMVNFSSALLRPFRKNNPEFSVLDLKSHYRGCRYASETIKLLPQKPDAILLTEIFQQIARLGMVHPTFEPVSTA